MSTPESPYALTAVASGCPVPIKSYPAVAPQNSGATGVAVMGWRNGREMGECQRDASASNPFRILCASVIELRLATSPRMALSRMGCHTCSMISEYL